MPTDLPQLGPVPFTCPICDRPLATPNRIDFVCLHQAVDEQNSHFSLVEYKNSRVYTLSDSNRQRSIYYFHGNGPFNYGLHEMLLATIARERGNFIGKTVNPVNWAREGF